MTPTGENIARADTGGCGQTNWDPTPKPSIIERMVHFLRRNTWQLK